MFDFVNPYPPIPPVVEEGDINKGDIVKFKEYLDPGDEELRMLVLEVNDDRVMVESRVNMRIRPVGIVNIYELTVTHKA